MSPSEQHSGRSGLRIGIDATCLASGRGYGRFLRELLPPLVRADDGHEYVLFLDAHIARELEPLPVRTVVPLTSQSQAAAASARGQRRIADMWRMGRAVAAERLDVFYFPSVYSYYPVPGRTPVAVAFHDVIPERHGDVVFPSRWNRMLWDAKVRLARRRAAGLITVSEWSRQALAEHFATPIERIFVTVEAPSPLFRPTDTRGPLEAWLAAQGLPRDAEPFVYVGGFNPHKNLPALIDAFARVAASRPRLQLLLVGDHEGDVFHIDVGALRARIAAHGLGDRVHLTGFVPDETLRHLYAHALALLLPSLEEGFGLPAVEAAACGTGCIATTRSPLPQLLAGGGIFIDPGDPEALTAALARVADDAALRRRHGERAAERAAALSWQATARATRDALEAIASGRGADAASAAAAPAPAAGGAVGAGA